MVTCSQLLVRIIRFALDWQENREYSGDDLIWSNLSVHSDLPFRMLGVELENEL